MDVQKMVESGIPLREAIIAELGRRDMDLTTWAKATGHRQAHVSRIINKVPGQKWDYRYDELRDALCRAFGFTREWLDAQIDG